jgi:hypothetical protein
MKKANTFAAIAAVTFLGISSAYAQDPAPQPRPEPQAQAAQPAADAKSVSGELVKVDAEAKKIAIKGADGTEQMFAYSDATEVTGAEGVAGLATKAGTRVTVHFTGEGDARTATKIEVQAQR